MKHTLNKLPKSTYEALVTVPWKDVEAAYKNAFDKLATELTVEGFRKGKAPQAIAEKHISKEDAYQQLIRDLLPQVYEDIVKAEKLQPIVSPRVELIKAKENEDWEFKLTIAEKPQIDLGDYKKAIHEAVAKGKKADIWVPGKGEEKKPDEEATKQQQMNTVLSTLITTTKCEISEVVIEEELNHRLTRLLDDIQKLGLTADAYLKSKNTTMEEMRAKLSKEIEETYKLEFVLAELAEKENITVEKKDLDVLFSHITDEKERKAAQENAYFYASILRKQKVLEYLGSL